jgi:hypothetical protein
MRNAIRSIPCFFQPSTLTGSGDVDDAIKSDGAFESAPDMSTSVDMRRTKNLGREGRVTSRKLRGEA